MTDEGWSKLTRSQPRLALTLVLSHILAGDASQVCSRMRATFWEAPRKHFQGASHDVAGNRSQPLKHKILRVRQESRHSSRTRPSTEDQLGQEDDYNYVPRSFSGSQQTY